MVDSICIALYARVSSQRQAGEATIQSQVAALRERIAADGLHIADERCFLDDGVSGTILHRPALERLRDLAWAGGIDRLYVHAPDRLARQYAHQWLLLDEFTRHGVNVVFLNHDTRDASPEGALLVQMQGMIAEYERAKILERTRRGRRFAARQGKVSVLSRAPYGYRYISKQDGDGAARYEIAPDEARVVRNMFMWVAIEGLSLGDVSKRLEEQKILTPMGLPQWERTTIRGILRNPAYTGTARFGKKRIVPRKQGVFPTRRNASSTRSEKVAQLTSPEEQEAIPVPVLISPDLFAAAEERLLQNQRRQRERKAGAEYLMSGLMVCHCCGSAYCGRRQRSSPGAAAKVSYRCLGTDKHRHHGVAVCTNTAISGQALEDRVWQDVRQLLQDPDRLRREFERRLEHHVDESPEIAAHKQSMAQLKQRLSRLMDAYEHGWLDRTEFEPRARRVREQISRLAEVLADHQQSVAKQHELQQALLDFRSFAQRLSAGLDQADFATKRDLMKILIKRIEVDKEEVRIVYRVEPRPFDLSPASNTGERGNLHYCSSRHGKRWGS